MMASTAVKSVLIRCPSLNMEFRLALFGGVEPSSLAAAVAARAGLRQDCSQFFLTTMLPEADPADSDVVVPLCGALPDGLQLTLHVTRGAPTNEANSVETSVVVSTVEKAPATRGQVLLPLPLPSSSRLAPPPVAVSRPVPVTLAVPRAPAFFQSGRSSAGDLDEPLLSQRGAAPHSHRGVSSDGDVSGRPMGSPECSPTPWFWLSSFFRDSDRRLDDAQESSCQSSSMNFVNAVERFNRMSTELANERTLLAWIRTCLAAIRTALCFIGIMAYASPWQISIYVAQWSMLAVVMVAAVGGAARYSRLKAVLEQKVTPRNFGRISLRPLSGLVILSSVATTAGILAQEWRHGG
mmetsp:Transcript_32568/g.107408  ORF Transcript_32568/g.107408 Transcript_32568/m.107408 type:complete len:352 (+) Transcript_32568:131-1186(+)